MAERTLILAVDTEDADVPSDNVAFAGFRFKLTAPSGAEAASDVVVDAVYSFAGATVGTTYTCSVVAVDVAGKDIGPVISVAYTVPGEDAPPPPPGLRYPRPSALRVSVV